MIWSDRGLEWDLVATIKDAKDHLFIQTLIISPSEVNESQIDLIIEDRDGIGEA